MNTFWMVYVEGGSYAFERHDDLPSAKTEAERLASSVKKPVFVLEAIAVCEATTVIRWSEKGELEKRVTSTGDNSPQEPWRSHAAISLADVVLAEAKADSEDIFGPTSPTVTPPPVLPIYLRRRKFSVDTCELNHISHLHQRQLDGSIVCMAPWLGSVKTGMDGVVDHPWTSPEQAHVAGGYEITFEDVQECYWATGSHRHSVKGDEVTCLAPEELWKPAS